MVGPCAAPGCTNHNSPNRHVSYFHFPNSSKNPDLYKSWISALKIRNLEKLRKHACICELHFSEDDYDETYKMKKTLMPSEYFRPILKPHAVPKLEVQGVGRSGNADDEKEEILRQLLGDSYLTWKTRRGSVNQFFQGVEIKMEERGVKQEKVEVDEDSVKVFNITRNFFMKRPLKPLPVELQRLLPSILSVVIKEVSNTEEEESDDQPETQFKCQNPLPVKCFHCCKLCNFKSFLKINLLNHCKSAHQPIKTRQVERLPMKIYKHKEPKLYSCGNCDFSTFSSLMLSRHAHKTKEYHLLTQIDLKRFKCQLCEYKTRYSSGLKKHVWVRHGSKCSDKNKFNCDRCDYSSEGEKNLKKHLKRGHGCTGGFRCAVCVYRGLTLSALGKHVAMRHPKRHCLIQCVDCDFYGEDRSE